MEEHGIGKLFFDAINRCLERAGRMMRGGSIVDATLILPPYAPESNPDEYLNHALKLSIHSGALPRTKDDIKHNTESFMRSLQRNKPDVSAFFRHKLLP